MKVCFITSEIFAGRRRGGFGKLVHVVGQELLKRGFDVSVICWRDPSEKTPKELNGMEILSYPYDFTTSSSIKHLVDYTKVIPLIKKADSDVYLSIDCMVETYLAQRIMPDRKHVIWVQDPFPYEKQDYDVLRGVDPYYGDRFNFFRFWTTVNLYKYAYKNANLILTQARYFKFKLSRLFKVRHERIIYLPNPVEYIPPRGKIDKAETPTICFLGRLDPVKRYWLFFELARHFPMFKFIVIGRPTLDVYWKIYEHYKKEYQSLNNLELLGFIDGEKKFDILSKCWILTLTSIREALPLAFIEGLAHQCALLSSVNPDGIVSAFGFWAKNDNFVEGLFSLIDNHNWRLKGELGYNYVCKNHQLSNIVERLSSLLEMLHTK